MERERVTQRSQAAVQRKERASLQLSLSVLKFLFAILQTPPRALPLQERPVPPQVAFTELRLHPRLPAGSSAQKMEPFLGFANFA
jgi:hypothetical protein